MDEASLTMLPRQSALESRCRTKEAAFSQARKIMSHGVRTKLNLSQSKGTFCTIYRLKELTSQGWSVTRRIWGLIKQTTTSFNTIIRRQKITLSLSWLRLECQVMKASGFESSIVIISRELAKRRKIYLEVGARIRNQLLFHHGGKIRHRQTR
jgi:hypothetical protein